MQHWYPQALSTQEHKPGTKEQITKKIVKKEIAARHIEFSPVHLRMKLLE
jgi:hypothetical protein